jgi:hypothetical protein
MPHGREHQRRDQVRMKNASDADAWQTNLSSAGRKRGAPPEGLMGAQKSRRAPTGGTANMTERELAPASEGSEVAPTPRAVERERERHARERAAGRVAAGTMARRRAAVKPGLKRADIEAAARAADAKVSGKGPAKGPAKSRPGRK